MAAEEQQLIVSIEGRINSLEKAMQRASTVTGDTYGQIERRAKQAAQNIDRSFSNDNLKNIGKGAELTSQQLVILNAAARDAFASLASGQSAMTTLLQQGSNVTAALGEDGVMGLVSGIGSGLRGLITPATAAGALIVGVGAAGALSLSKYNQYLLEAELRLTGLGTQSSQTAESIARIGEEASRSGRQSSSSARDIALVMAASGKLKGEDIAGLTALAPGIQRILGVETKELAAKMAGMFSDPAKGAEELDGKLGLLDDRTRQLVRSMAQQGDRQGALKTLLAAVTPALQEAAEKTTLWARAWNTLASAADGAAMSVGKALNGPTLQEQLDAARARRDRAAPGAGKSNEDDYVKYLKEQKLSEAQIASLVPSYRPSIDGLNAEVKALEERVAAEEKLAAAKRETIRLNEASKAAGEIVREYNREAETVQELTDRYSALAKALAEPAIAERIDGGAVKAAESIKALEQRVGALTADYKAGGTAAAAALRQADYNKATAGLDTYRKGLADINRQYDEQIRLAKTAGDTANQAARVATLEAARSADVSAYKRNNDDRARASVGLPDGFTAATIAAESSGNDSAKNPRSSATGAGQFISSTWLSLFKEVYSEMASTLSDDAILALRTNRTYSARLIEEYARKNAIALQNAGFDGTDRNLHLAHFLGSGGAISMLKADPGANAASILPAAARANPEVFRNGSATVEDILSYASRRGQRSGASGRSQEDATRRLQAEREAYSKSAEEAERLKSIEEQISADREKNGEISQRFKNAQDLIKASSAELTPELRAQREEILKLANARGKAAGDNVRTRFDEDIKRARESLGRTSGEQSDVDRVRGLGVDPSSAQGKSMAGELSQLRTMQELRSAASGFATGFASDIMRGTNALQALQNQLTRVADKLLSMVIDNLVTKAFGALLGGGTGGTGGGGGFNLFAGLGNLLGFAGGGQIVGPGNGTSDSILARVSNGEFITNAAATKEWLPVLRMINEGRMPRFATGGLVGGSGFADAMPAGAGPIGGPSISTPITVHVSGNPGSNERENGQVGENIAKAMETQVRSIVGDELRRARRPGGIFDKS